MKPEKYTRSTFSLSPKYIFVFEHERITVSRPDRKKSESTQLNIYRLLSVLWSEMFCILGLKLFVVLIEINYIFRFCARFLEHGFTYWPLCDRKTLFVVVVSASIEKRNCNLLANYWCIVWKMA